MEERRGCGAFIPGLCSRWNRRKPADAWLECVNYVYGTRLPPLCPERWKPSCIGWQWKLLGLQAGGNRMARKVETCLLDLQLDVSLCLRFVDLFSLAEPRKPANFPASGTLHISQLYRPIRHRSQYLLSWCNQVISLSKITAIIRTRKKPSPLHAGLFQTRGSVTIALVRLRKNHGSGGKGYCCWWKLFKTQPNRCLHALPLVTVKS